MTSFVLMNNHTDCGINKTIATKCGLVEPYNQAMKLFKERRIPNYNYVILQRDVRHADQPRVITNYFGEVTGLGGAPWMFGLSQ